MIRLKVFRDGATLTTAVVAELRAHIGSAPDKPNRRAVMLAGGSTPMSAYQKIALAPFPVGPDVRVFFSDERHVSPDSSNSNYGNTKAMLRALKIPDPHILRVHGQFPLPAAVARYEADLRGLIEKGFRITFGLLGLGMDGHTASLFKAEHIEQGKQRFVIGVNRPDGVHGITTTPDFLSHVEQIVFLVGGVEKRPVLQKLLHETLSIPAGQAVQGCRNVEVWADPEAGSK